MAVVGWFAVFHGYAHALEAPPAIPALHAGLPAATALLQAAGLDSLGVHKAVATSACGAGRLSGRRRFVLATP
jgi:hydrogenase/urease accessory protein HupE